MDITIQPLEELDSYTYGKYFVRRIGRINILQCHDINKYCKWSDKYHPRVYFRFLFSKNKTSITDERDVYAWDVYVPLIEDNINWDLKASMYYNDCIQHGIKPSKKLPIAFTHKHVVKWREKSIEHLEI